MDPSQVRERILKEHDQLHARLGALEKAVHAMVSDPRRVAAVVETARALLEDFVTHTELEDQILGAALLEIDAWGPVRAQSMRAHHEEQRRSIRELLVVYQQTQSQDEVEEITNRWIADVRCDMRHEESDILTHTLLRDDLIAVAMESG